MCLRKYETGSIIRLKCKYERWNKIFDEKKTRSCKNLQIFDLKIKIGMMTETKCSRK